MSSLLAWLRTFTDVFPGPEKTQAVNDEADLEKFQELLVRTALIVGLAVLRFFLGKNDERGCSAQATGGGATKG